MYERSRLKHQRRHKAFYKAHNQYEGNTMNLKTIRKALVPVGVAGVLSGLAYLGIAKDMTVQQAVTLLVTSVLVYLIPNEG